MVWWIFSSSCLVKFVFIVLIGWEWSFIFVGVNFYWVVFISVDVGIVSKFLFLSFIDSLYLWDFWKWFDEIFQCTGVVFVVVLYNFNIFKGRMFDEILLGGEVYIWENVIICVCWELVVEVTQFKGDSEIYLEFLLDDFFVDFEIYFYYIQTDFFFYEVRVGDYVCFVFFCGLVIEEQIGFNFYCFGLVGLMDLYMGFVLVEELNFWGKFFCDFMLEIKNVEW